MMKQIATAALVMIVAGYASASDSPHAGEQMRAIKSLSSGEVHGYLNGHGMGYAKAAELNDFPGPRHVLDLADELDLRPEQVRRTREIFNSMRGRASSLGARLVAAEAELDRMFGDGTIDEVILDELVSEIGLLEARIRQIHLQAHLAQRAVLNRHQVRRYAELRGYAASGHDKHAH